MIRGFPVILQDNGQGPIKVSTISGSGDIIVLVCHVILK